MKVAPRKGLITLIYESSLKRIVSIIFIIFCIGQILNFFWKHNIFYINQSMLIIMLIIQLGILKHIQKEKNLMKKIIDEKNEIEVLGLFSIKISRILDATITKCISIVLVIIYISTMFILRCLEFTPTGFYGGVLGALVFYIGIKAYLHYITLLYFAYDLRNIQIKNYSFYFPALTEWFGRLAKEFSFVEKWFLFLGAMYTTIYAINLPISSILHNGKIDINTPNNIMFFITWIGIFFLFVFAFPLLTFLSRSFLKYIIYACKCTSIKIIEKQMAIFSVQTPGEDLDLIEKQISLVKAIETSDNYPIKYSRTIFDSMYSISMALVTLLSPFFSIIEKIFFKS